MISELYSDTVVSWKIWWNSHLHWRNREYVVTQSGFTHSCHNKLGTIDGRTRDCWAFTSQTIAGEPHVSKNIYIYICLICFTCWQSLGSFVFKLLFVYLNLDKWLTFVVVCFTIRDTSRFAAILRLFFVVVKVESILFSPANNVYSCSFVLRFNRI